MKDSPGSSRPISWMVTCALVAAFIEWSPHKYMQKQSAELGALHLTMFDHKRDLMMKSFWPVFVTKLSDTDMRLVALSHGEVLFWHECAVYCSSLAWNAFLGQTKSLLHAWDVRPPTTHDDSACVTAICTIGQYFFDGVVSGVTCIKCRIMLY